MFHLCPLRLLVQYPNLPGSEKGPRVFLEPSCMLLVAIAQQRETRQCEPGQHRHSQLCQPVLRASSGRDAGLS
jgi:hypothetical protein